MRPDVRELLRAIGVRGFTYREMRAGAEPAVLEAPQRRPRSDVTIAFASPIPRAGRTTLCAGVARALSRRGWRAAAFDIDPDGDLAAHVGAGPGGRRDVACVPHGESLSPAADALVAGCDAIVIDTPVRPSREVEHALARADEVVLVLRPDAASRAALAATDALLVRSGVGAWRRARARYLVNGFDGRQLAHRAALAKLRERLGDRLMPFTVQWDEAVEKALASATRLEDEAPGSQALADLERLAEALAPARTRAPGPAAYGVVAHGEPR